MNFVSLATLGLAVTLLLAKWRVVRRSTLLGPGVWLFAAIAALGVASGLNWRAGGQPTPVAEFLAASLTICPTVSVLGAKRPQDRAWHFVVAALYVVLVLPVTDGLVFGHVDGIELHVVRRVFLGILIGIGMANYLGTRFWLSALLYAVGQVALLGPSLFPHAAWSSRGGLDVGCVLVGLAITLACMGIPRRSFPRSGLTRVWLDFRDTFGAAWALRVADRMNRASEKLQWGVRLRWSGFVNSDGASAEPPAGGPAERSFRTLLRRFVLADAEEGNVQRPA